MTLPPGLSQSDFDDALNDFRQLLGESAVFTIDAHVESYRDPYSPRQNETEEAIPSAAVAPETVEKVQGVVEIANRYKIPLWIISSGKNFGYGGPEARVNGSVIVDLKRMNRILEINENQAYALVEPGVSHYDLWREIQKRGYRLWIDGPSPAYASIVANTIERGVGYGLLGERINAMCGMEVVLPTGELVRTGMGAMSAAETWQQYKYGLGPVVDGLFSQSNNGIVTKMGIWLIPEPPAFRSAEIYVKNYEDIVAMIDTLRPLRLGGVIANSASMGPNFGGHHENGEGPGGNIPGEPHDEPPGWRARLGFYGYDKVVETNWEQTQDEFSAAIPGVTFHSSRYTAPYDPDVMNADSKQAAGIPSFQETSLWNHGGTFASMVLPLEGQALMKLIGKFNEIYQRYGMRFVGGPLHNHSPHSLVILAGAPLKAGDTAFNQKIREMISAVIVEGGQMGWGEYRTPIVFMDDAARAYDFNDNALLKLNERIKDSLDPNGIMAPGKNGIWPQNMRNA